MKTYWRTPFVKQTGLATREAYGRTLLDLGKENSDIVVLDADLSKSTYTGLFGQQFPDRFFNVGIAEANMVSIASGLASTGKIPFVSSFAVFLMCKAFDQLRMCVAYPHNNVKVVVTHGGISIGEDGPSQQSVEDIGLACLLPGFSVLVPADEIATRELVKEIANKFGPAYIRTGRPKTPIVYGADEKFAIGGSKILSDGKDVAIITNGLMVAVAIEAAEICSKKGIEVSVVDAYSVKPIDKDTIIRVAKETKRIIVLEEHLYHGGLGSVVAQLLAKECPTPIEFISMNDSYAESASPNELLARYGFSTDNIVKAVESILKKEVIRL